MTRSIHDPRELEAAIVAAAGGRIDFSSAEAGPIIGLSRTVIEDAIHRGAIPTRRDGRIHAASIAVYLTDGQLRGARLDYADRAKLDGLRRRRLEARVRDRLR